MEKIAIDLLNILEASKDNIEFYIRDPNNYTIKKLENEHIDDPDELIEIIEVPDRNIVIIIGMICHLGSWLDELIFYMQFNVRKYVDAYMIPKDEYKKREKDIKDWIYHSE